MPHHYVEPALLRCYRAAVFRGPVRAVGSKDEERDLMESVRIDEHSGLAVEKVTNGSAFERGVGIALERYDWREVQPTLEPWLHMVKTPALDLEGTLA